MSTRRFLWALACTCTSAVLAVTAVAAEGEADRAVGLALELELARTPTVYLVLDPWVGKLEIKARGLVLETVPVDRVAVLTLAPLVSRPASAVLELPTMWRLVSAPEESWRREVAPTTLRPYSEDEVAPTPTPTPKLQTAPAAPAPAVPDDYACLAENGWQLRVTATRTGGLRQRLVDSIASGWRRLGGEALPQRPSTLVVEVTSEDARRLCHLLRPGLAVILAGP